MLGEGVWRTGEMDRSDSVVAMAENGPMAICCAKLFAMCAKLLAAQIEFPRLF